MIKIEINVCYKTKRRKIGKQFKMIGEIATDEELLRFYGKDEINETKPHEKLLEKVKKTTACSSKL